MDKNSKIYIAGHRGMVGSALVRKFKSEGYNNLILRTRDELDLTSQSATEIFFKKEKPDFVIDSAAKVGGILANSSYIADFLFENLQIQNNLIWFSHKYGVKKFLFLGSSCIYPRESIQPMIEESFLKGPFEPTNEGYAVAKVAGIKLCEKIFEQYGKTFISCIPTNIYGENDNFDPNSSHVIPGIIKRIHEAKVKNLPEVVIWGTGNALREFMYVDDLADAVLWIMLNYNDKEFLNVGTGKDISIRELAKKIKEVVGYRGDLKFDVSKPDGMPRKLLDVSRLSKLGWEHKISFDEGINKIYQYYLSIVTTK